MISYQKINHLSCEDFIDVLEKSSLSERRPVNDVKCLQGMIDHSNLIIGAYHNHSLIGIARAVTDFHYCCYLSDLAVSKEFQNQGVGKSLINKAFHCLQPTCKLILLSAPSAEKYYPKIGFIRHESCWFTTKPLN
ncbi:uncharacterized protein METZ01_LOCUS206279 [marine metagenome]|uniref:N-acetyltransferase domain-containing protein n=1 Tax=marine metagenome TaxID=408172 RepID=A0A382ESQ8_9ZZZZ